MIDVFYYYYYLFYTKVLSEDQPHSTVVFTLSFSLSLFVNGIFNLVTIHFANFALPPSIMIGTFIIIGLVNYFVYYRKGKGMRLVKRKPRFFNSHRITIILTLLFFLVTTSFLFWGPIYLKSMIDLK